MKKILFSIFVCIVISCENDSQETMNSNAKINQILQLESLNEQKLAYSLLNSDEKAAIWKKHLDVMISTNNYSEKQLNFINEIKKSLTTNFFSKKDNSKDTFNESIISEGLKIFSKQELYSLIANLSSTSKLPGAPPISTCGCSTSSDWCLSGDCSGTAYCLRDSDNCGTFWQYTCNGDCA